MMYYLKLSIISHTENNLWCVRDLQTFTKCKEFGKLKALKEQINALLQSNQCGIVQWYEGNTPHTIFKKQDVSYPFTCRIDAVADAEDIRL